MDKVQILQALIKDFGKISYQGAFLWKYIEYEMTSGIIKEYQNQEKNRSFKYGLNDNIPEIPEELIQITKDGLEEFTQKDILYAMLPIRRMYKGRLEHTAFEPYVEVMDDDKYVVIESSILGKNNGEPIPTKNLKYYSAFGIVGLYGQDIVNREELINFVMMNYVKPIEAAYGIKFPQETTVKCIFKLSNMLKRRPAYLSYFQEVIRRTKPKIIVYSHAPDPTFCCLREAAQIMGVPTAEIEHGGTIRNLVYPETLAYSDYYLTHSDLLTDKMKDKGLKNVYTVGKPFIYSSTECNSKNEFKPIVVSIISSLEKDLYLKARDLAARLDKKDYIVVFKMHSSEEWSEEEKQQVTDEFSNWIFIDGYEDVRDLFEISDIVVGVRSSGILDALPFQKLKVLVLRDKYEKELLVGNLDFFDRLSELGDVIKIDNEDQLYEEVTNYKRGTDYREKENHYWPADAEERFRKFIQIFLDGKRPIDDEKNKE